MQAADIMTPDVICAGPETPLAELVHLMLDNRISAVPIVANGQLVGIVSEGDLLRRAETGTEPRPSRWLELMTSSNRLAADYTRTHGIRASEVMTRDVVTVIDTTSMADIAQLLAAKRIKRVPVMRGDKLVGIVSRRNLLYALASRLSGPPGAGPTAQARSMPSSPMAWFTFGALRRTTRGVRPWWLWRKPFPVCVASRTIWTGRASSIRWTARTGPARRGHDVIVSPA